MAAGAFLLRIFVESPRRPAESARAAAYRAERFSSGAHVWPRLASFGLVERRASDRSVVQPLRSKSSRSRKTGCAFRAPNAIHGRNELIIHLDGRPQSDGDAIEFHDWRMPLARARLAGGGRNGGGGVARVRPVLRSNRGLAQVAPWRNAATLSRVASRPALARPGRFELPTPGSVDQCSIQLSYGRFSPCAGPRTILALLSMSTA